MPSDMSSKSASKLSSKPSSRWDCLANTYPDAAPARHNYRPRNTKLAEAPKWINDTPRTVRKPDVSSSSQFPTLGTASTDVIPIKDYSLLENLADEDVPTTAEQPSDGNMINVRKYLAAKKQSDEPEQDPYLSYKMFDAIEDMKARWYLHDLLHGTFVDYDCCIEDEEGIDAWETESESDGSDTDYNENYDST